MWGASRIFSPVKLEKIKKIRLRSLKMTLWAYSKWRNIYPRKSTQIGKNCEIMWYLNKDQQPPSDSHLRLIDTPPETAIAKNTWLLFSSNSQLEGYLPERDSSSAFLVLSQQPVVEAKCWASVAKWVPFIFPASTHRMEALPWMQHHWEHCGHDGLALARGVGVSTLRERQVKEIWSCCLPRFST